jgi:lipoprotein signal peptidase
MNSPFWRVAAIGGAVLTVSQGSRQLAAFVAERASIGWIAPIGNHDLSLGTATGSPSRLATLAIVAMLIAGAALWRSTASGIVPAWSAAFLLGGAASNALDRLTVGAVQDWLVTPWAICNLADVVIVVGAAGVAWSFWTGLPEGGRTSHNRHLRFP